MLSGLKFIPRDQVDKAIDDISEDSRKKRRKSGHKKEKIGTKMKHSRYSSSDDDGVEGIKSGSRKKKKWYDSNEDMSSNSEESGSHIEVDRDRKKRKSWKKEKKRHDHSSDNEYKIRSKKKSHRRKKGYSSDKKSGSGSESEKSSENGIHHKGGVRKEDVECGTKNSDKVDNDNMRKEMGLGWMLRPKDNKDNYSNKASLNEQEEASGVTIKKDNARELNPYLKDNGDGYPDESDGQKAGDKRLLSKAVVGDGGASWRLKALKRAQEQAAREGRKLQEVVEERWDSMGHLAASVASENVAPSHAHLQAIRHRRKGSLNEEHKNIDEENNRDEKDFREKTTKDVLSPHPKMRVPKVHDSLSWGKRKNKSLSSEDTALVSTALSSLNKFSNDGNFLAKFMPKEENDSGDPGDCSKFEARAEPRSVEFGSVVNKDDVGTVKPPVSANQLAAKALQLRMKGKHEEAEKLLKEAAAVKERQSIGDGSSRKQIDGSTTRLVMHEVSARQTNKEDDGDTHLAQRIMHNHRYSVSGQADEEYDYDDGPRIKSRKKGQGGNYKSTEITNYANRFLTQQDRCQFCFENSARAKHLVIAIGNFTYLALPQQQPVVPGHCGILTLQERIFDRSEKNLMLIIPKLMERARGHWGDLDRTGVLLTFSKIVLPTLGNNGLSGNVTLVLSPLQHESSTRTLEDNVWDEIRNFKKCLIMMFAKQEKDVMFLETVMGLAQQRRHCMVECVPLPRDVAKQAPVYFKKAIDEAEDEWSQHNAKKLIDTSEKGLCGSIPKNFPYFHVEFGLNRGFVHVIDNEREFKSNFGLNVVRGMLRLPAEDMYRRRRQESVETQKQAVASFVRDWEPFDWTKQL
ncbi:hypothetical protein OROMI_032835 [Orobanche minor]